jgi:muconolactone delta-isomerase
VWTGRCKSLYHLDFDVDVSRMGSNESSIRKGELDRISGLIAEGVVVAEWLKANGRGAVSVWNCRDHEHLRKVLGTLPMTPYFTRIDVTPCVEHPLLRTELVRRGRAETDKPAAHKHSAAPYRDE